MNSNEILNKYINLIDKGYCSDCNELNCIDNFPHSKITHAIRELQQENKQLNNILTELEETIKNKIKGFKEDKDYFIDEKDMYELDNLIQKLKENESK